MLEAWPQHYPGWITHHKRPLANRVADVMTVFAVAGMIVVGLLYGLGAL